jgi:mono/diheme cytochrome c family protein
MATRQGCAFARALTATLAMTILGGGVVGGAGQRNQQSIPASQPPAESVAGSESFEMYCASCHGQSARGDGPMSRTLRTAPADLTLLARRNKGVFPRDRVAASIVDSTRPAAHGTLDMPIWGPSLRALNGADDRENQRLRNLLAFLESIQVASNPAATTGRDADGASLYRDHCSVCHGADGQGNGPFRFALKTVPPSLRNLAARNGGVFPRDRTARVIEGADLPAHGQREMPVWGQVFRRLRPQDAGAGQRIDALVTFLERIQDRPAR